MINTLGKFREEMDGSRIPKYEVTFLEKKKRQQKRQRQKQRHERRQKQKEEAEKANEVNRLKTMKDISRERGKMSTTELFFSYKVNDYSLPEPAKQPAQSKVTFKVKDRSRAKLQSSMQLSQTSHVRSSKFEQSAAKRHLSKESCNSGSRLTK